MGFVVLYLVLSLLAAAPFGWALSRFLLGRMPAVPDQNRTYLSPDPHPTVRQ
ncbi:hypothetical protein [[Kitasatospora] papulosa]|uniref:hypothetical protein n=1 Tax=[Kitasatospora] papulosa TaxID=1464011 RepID=UPI0036344222